MSDERASEVLPYWVAIDFGTDHTIVRSAHNPNLSLDYDDQYFVGPYPTLGEAKERIRAVTKYHRTEMSDKLNYWMELTVGDIPVG